jgi:outer membrane immunogenic protein
MKKLLLSTVAATALMGGSALAADLPVRTLAPAPAPVAYAPAFTWAGVYAGFNLGVGRRTGNGEFVIDDEIDIEGGFPVNFVEGPTGTRFGDRDNWRLSGGAQVGVNGQWGSLVAGLEADFNWLGDGRRSGVVETVFAEPGFEGDCDFEGDCVGGRIEYSGGKSRWVSTVRGRLGFAWDRFLVYGTGGVAFQQASSTRTQTTVFETDGPGTFTFETLSSNRNQVGWAAGFGVEWAFLNNMSLGLEYLHIDFGAYDVRYIDPVGGLIGIETRFGGSGERTVRVDDKIDLARLKLNVRF